MNLLNFKTSKFNFIPLDWVTLLYILFSTVYILFGASQLNNSLPFLAFRLLMLGIVLLLAYLSKLYASNKTVSFFRNLYPLLFTGYLYSETFYFKNFIFSTDFDAHLAHIDRLLFGCEPGFEFSKLLPQVWFKELMAMCYFSYFLIIIGFSITIYLKNKVKMAKAIFVITTSFFIYYSLYALIPVAGPKFHYHLSPLTPNHIFENILYHILIDSEKPTGAFPSSHIGISVIVCYLAYHYHRFSFYVYLPLTIGICFATVYLQAHYVIDVIAAFVSIPLFIWFSQWLYSKFVKILPKVEIETQNI